MVKNKNVDTRGPNGLGQTRPGPTQPGPAQPMGRNFWKQKPWAGLGWPDFTMGAHGPLWAVYVRKRRKNPILINFLLLEID
jgi:hypothetical protein